ncbi:YoaK family protein [Mycobacteroides abscessus subsp. abscessus]|uniref:YoaK family protein n=1 Tax=Mycobacteroides abscessus TaxID=36809 RepID=UPI00266BCE6A|nr:YoaK family protein [Mycobacteroides abscessus]MDO3104575.1 YoaK family protein [Mycobacteroides abscessus subsp. abscessus]
MRQYFSDAARLLVPARDPAHGPLPILLLSLTVVTGIIDAFSYLSLSHVLVANMTGNVVFSAFGAVGAPGFVWWALLLAVAAFLAGALIGGYLRRRVAIHRGRHLLYAVISELLLVCAAWVLSLCAVSPFSGWNSAGLVILLRLAMGIQNSTARALAVPDLTTTVLTLTLTGIGSDAASGHGSKIGRRTVPIAAMFLGAAAGAALVQSGLESEALALAAGALAITATAALATAQSSKPWTATPGSVARIGDI